MPEAMSVISRDDGAATAALSASRLPSAFADDLAGHDYFLTDNHHRHLAAAVFRQLAKGHGFILLAGEPAADGELLERLLNEEGKQRYRATFLRCGTETDFGALVRAYNRRLGLKQESGSDGIWALLSHLMQEVRRGVARVLVLERADVLDATCFDELLRFTRLDEPHVMPVVLLSGSGFDERLAAAGLDFLQPAITCRLATDRLEPAEIGAFVRYQLNALPEEDQAAFSADAVNRIAAEAGTDAAAVNRLARALLGAATSGRERPARSVALVAPAEPPAEAAEMPSAAVTEAQPAPAPLALSDPLPPPQAEGRKFRLPSALIAGIYVLAISFAGLGLLYLVAPRHTQPKPAQIASSTAVPSPAPAPRTADAPGGPAAGKAPEALPALAASQSAAIEPAAGTPAASTILPVPQPTDAGEQVAGAPTDAETAAAAPVPEPPPLGSHLAEDAPAASPGTAQAPAEQPAPAGPPTDTTPAAPPASVPAPPTSESNAADDAPAASAANSPLVQGSATPGNQATDAAPAAASARVVSPPTPAPKATDHARAALDASSASAREPESAAALPAGGDPSSASAAAPAATAAPAPSAPQVAVLEAAPAPSTAGREAPLDAGVALMVRRGDELLATGDVVSARRFFEIGAQAGDAAALCGVAKTYDAEFLRLIGARGVSGDDAEALGWYRRAAAAGSAEAAARLQTMTPKRSTPEDRR